MPAQKGSEVLLKVGNAGSPTETFTLVGGIRNVDFSFSSKSIDISHNSSGHWQELLDDAGKRSVSISGDGLFTSSESEELIR